MKKYLITFFATLFFVGMVSVATTQDVYMNNYLKGETVSASIADDQAVALLIRYVGTNASGKVAVEADGNLTFLDGALGAEAATDSFECPVSGALGGIVDVSDAACNTLGEVVDSINGSGDWVAVIVDGLRADTSDDVMLAAASAQAQAVEGYKTYFDTDVAKHASWSLTTQRDLRDYINDKGKFHVNPFDDYRTIVHQMSALSTYGAGSSAIKFYSVKTDYQKGSETATELWSEAAGASTAVKTIDKTPYGYMSKKGERLLIRVVNTDAMATTALKAYGVEWAWK